MLSFIRLIRLQNLLIIAFTQYMVRWFLLYPILKAKHIEFQLSEFHFFLLSLSTVMIAAAGYTINDYFDINLDKINKPERLVIGKGIKRRVAMGAHSIINIVAILIALYVSLSIGFWKLSIIHFICATGLWFYSTNFKRQFFIGNVVIASFTAMVPIIVGLFELLPTFKTYSVFDPQISFVIEWKHVFGIAFFAFITTLIREIIKDIEDYDGDKEYGCNTLPITWGKQAAKTIVLVFTLFTMGCLGYLQLLQWRNSDLLSFYYILIALQLPFTFLIYKVITADTQKKYHSAGNITKIIMLSGICYLFVFSYLMFQYINAL